MFFLRSLCSQEKWRGKNEQLVRIRKNAQKVQSNEYSSQIFPSTYSAANRYFNNKNLKIICSTYK